MKEWRGPCGCGLLLAALLVGCGGDDDGGGGDIGALVDSLAALDREQLELECGCDMDSEACPPDGLSATEVRCYKQVAAAHAAEFEPELRCQIAALEAQNDCFINADCADQISWETCLDMDDCDDSVAETYEDEIFSCVD